VVIFPRSSRLFIGRLKLDEANRPSFVAQRIDFLCLHIRKVTAQKHKAAYQQLLPTGVDCRCRQPRELRKRLQIEEKEPIDRKGDWAIVVTTEKQCHPTCHRPWRSVKQSWRPCSQPSMSTLQVPENSKKS